MTTPPTAIRNALDALPARADGLKIMIAGAGIGGLATALALAQRGIASCVLERRAVFEPEGAGIQLGPNGTRILQELGVAEHLEPLAGKPDYIHARNAITGASQARLPLGDWIAARHGAPYWVLHRQDLHAALLRAAQSTPQIHIAMDFKVADVEANGEGVTVNSRNGQTRYGDALIAADGLRSHIRDEAFDAQPLRFAQKSAARAVIPIESVPSELRENATALWMSPLAHVVHYPVRGGRELALIFVRKDMVATDDWSTEVPQSWVLEVAQTFCEPLRKLLQAPPLWKKWALFELPPLSFWHSGRIALLGDAAHPTLPFLAQGAVLALEDATTLARRISEQPTNVPRAIAAYAAARRHRAMRVVAAATNNGRIYHLDGPMATARDMALRVTPPRTLMARYDWVYGWRP